jgi:hypothetical protein
MIVPGNFYIGNPAHEPAGNRGVLEHVLWQPHSEAVLCGPRPGRTVRRYPLVSERVNSWEYPDITRRKVINVGAR